MFKVFMLPFSLPFYLLWWTTQLPRLVPRRIQRNYKRMWQFRCKMFGSIAYVSELVTPHCSDGVVCPPPKVAETTDACNGDMPCVTGEKILCCDQPPTTNHTATACSLTMTAMGRLSSSMNQWEAFEE
ncbi:hypothetical protein A0H81_02941 [Grifola frondosa]|uniref:WAP domain-containing protein n=1 Tax=Grifola frondosa TaxID=5627 RepID=A0A1C7MJ00_GRIFR|nr:hypothetical protein A0H81_02941 [Grifola frondosa]